MASPELELDFASAFREVIHLCPWSSRLHLNEDASQILLDLNTNSVLSSGDVYSWNF